MNRLRDALLVKRLKQVVHRIHFERFDRVLIEGSGKTNLRDRYFLVESFLDHPETVEPWHLHIKEYKVGIVHAEQINGFNAVLALGHNVHIVH